MIRTTRLRHFNIKEIEQNRKNIMFAYSSEDIDKAAKQEGIRSFKH